MISDEHLPAYVERVDHPDVAAFKETISDDEWDEDYVGVLDKLFDFEKTWTPATPPGFELVHCTAEPRHAAVFVAVNSEFYEPPCMYCAYDDIKDYPDKYRHLTTHHSRRWLWWARLLYRLELTTGYGHSWGSSAGCNGCLSWRFRTWPVIRQRWAAKFSSRPRVDRDGLGV